MVLNVLTSGAVSLSSSSTFDGVKEGSFENVFRKIGCITDVTGKPNNGSGSVRTVTLCFVDTGKSRGDNVGPFPHLGDAASS